MDTLTLLKRSIRNYQWLYFIKIFLVFSGIIMGSLLLNSGEIVITPILGALASGLTDLDDHIRRHLKNVGLILLIFFLSIVIVVLLFPHPLLFLISMVFGTASLTLLGALGLRYRTIAFGALIVATYTVLIYDPSQRWYAQALALVIGALWYHFVAFFFSWVWPIRPLQENVADCYRQLAEFLEVKSRFFDPDEIENFENQRIQLVKTGQKLDEKLALMRMAIMHRIKNDRGKRSMHEILNYYLIVQDIYERSASTYVDYSELKEFFMKNSDVLFRFQRLILQQSIGCQKISDQLLGKKESLYGEYSERLISRLKETLAYLQAKGEMNPHLLAATKALLLNLISIDQRLQKIRTATEVDIDASYIYQFTEYVAPQESFRYLFKKICRHITPQSEVFRHALRMSLVVGTSILVIWLINALNRHFGYDHDSTNYWILLTVIFVCQPNYSATKLRVVQRLSGTVFGVIIVLFLLKIHISEPAQLMLIVLSGSLFFVLRRERYSYATAFITIMVLTAFNLNNADFAAPKRILDTLIGCGLAWLAVTYIMPDWNYRKIDEKMSDIVNANIQYLMNIGAQYHNGREDAPEYLWARDNANQANSEMASLFANIVSEPKVDQSISDKVFKALCQNNVFFGYISALGAHRLRLEEESCLLLLDGAIKFVINALKDGVFDSTAYITLKEDINALSDQFLANDPTANISLLQQLMLLLRSLPSFIETVNELKKAEPSLRS